MNKQNFNTDYIFLSKFEVISYIRDPSTSVGEIQRLLLQTNEEVINESIVKQIISMGLEQYYEKTNNFAIYQSLSKEIKLMYKDKKKRLTHLNEPSLSSKQKNSRKKVTQSPLSIDAILSRVFGLLDIKSLSKCRNVNLQWLYVSYTPTRVSLDTGNEDLYNLSNLNIYRHCEKLCINYWLSEYNELFDKITLFKKFARLNINAICKINRNGKYKNKKIPNENENETKYLATIGKVISKAINEQKCSKISIGKSSHFLAYQNNQNHHPLFDKINQFKNGSKHLQHITLCYIGVDSISTFLNYSLISLNLNNCILFKTFFKSVQDWETESSSHFLQLTFD